MNDNTENLSAADVRALDIANVWKMIANLTLGAGIAIIATTTITVAVVVGHNSFGAYHAAQERYTQTEATIISEPDIANGTTYRANSTVTAKVATENGLETTTAVDNQAQAGDTITVWTDNETNTVWRATSATASPIVTQPLLDTIGSALITALLSLMLICWLSWRSETIVARGLRAKERAEESNRRAAWR